MAEIQESGGGGKKGGGKVRSKKAGGKPDMTPMVDLGFLLITFFMYTTTFGKPNMMKLNMPDKPNPDDPPPPEVKVTNTITVLMGKDDRIFWYQKPLPELTLADLNETDYSPEGIRKSVLVKKANALDINKFTVIIKPSDEANWKNTVDILDEMAITKSDRYAIVDLAPKEKELLDQKLAEPKK
ncbi:biopolymer transporter ExbD [Emticicia sp. BO119]|uniref:ExbD/TolR family protein n=1 Tax=Emticicia sp. BO119 TaxID=2757768 RepID=UPI0015F11F5E|nr:biopolymer transporter ExbD [Emticicia sp. BO119]MBA4849686.1 biopolymer transporter ExbD [Emticicia sp. BO119]